MDAVLLFEQIAQAFAERPGVTRAKVFGAPGLKVRGKVFACLIKDDLVIKLPRERVEAMIDAGDGHPFDPGMGRIMKEWIAIPPGNGDRWLAMAEEARDFVSAKT